jgi:hypothetical protein
MVVDTKNTLNQGRIEKLLEAFCVEGEAIKQLAHSAQSQSESEHDETGNIERKRNEAVFDLHLRIHAS